MAKVIGLTGSFGTGKSFAASVFKSLGAKVLDADMIARSVTAKGKIAHKKVLAAFGGGIIGKGREIDRGKLAEIVFADKKALSRLNRIVHPEVISIIKRSIRKAGIHDVVVVDAPLLIEAGLDRFADILVVVKAPRKLQIERCMKKFNPQTENRRGGSFGRGQRSSTMDRGGVIRRIANQIPLKKKIEMADFVVDNGGTRPETKKQIKRIWKETVWR